MSLINQMLQDLDARRAAHGVGSKLPNDVRPLPKAQVSHWPKVFGMLAVVATVAVGYFAYTGGADPFQALIAPTAMPFGNVAVSEDLAGAAAPAAQAVPDVVPAPERDPQGALVDLNLDGFDVSLRVADAISATPQASIDATPEPPVVPVPLKAPGPKPVAKIVEKPVSKELGRPAPMAAKAAPAQITPATVPNKPVVSEKLASQPVIERTAAVASPRERAELEYRKAARSVNQGDASGAEVLLQEVLRLDSLHAAARQLLVKLLLDGGKVDETIKVLKEGLVDQPAQLGWAMSLARLQVDRGDLAGAWQTLDFSMPAATANADYLGFAANVLQRQGRAKEAVAQYRRAANVSPGDGRWWLGLGLMLDGQGQNLEARDAFLRARQCANLGPDLLALIDQKLR